MIYLMFFLGLLFGSFASVLVSEFCSMVEGNKFDVKRFLIGRSKCPQCKKNLRWYNLIPVFSFLFQGGRCSNCNQKIGVTYIVIELLMGALFASFYFLYGFLTFHKFADLKKVKLYYFLLM